MRFETPRDSHFDMTRILKIIRKCFKDEKGGWEIVYTGFVLILLCFFIMLCSFSTMEEAKITKFVKSFVNTLCILQGGVKIDKGNVVIPPSPEIVSIKNKLAKLLQNIETYARVLGIEEDVSFSSTEDGLVMILSDKILFDLGKADLKSDGTVFLKKIASLFAQTSHNIRIEGHTDNLPIQTKRFPSNWELSTARAVNVLRYFIEQGNISLKRLTAVGFGEFQPLFLNDSSEHRSSNRRVEIILSTKRKTLEKAKI